MARRDAWLGGWGSERHKFKYKMRWFASAEPSWQFLTTLAIAMVALQHFCNRHASSMQPITTEAGLVAFVQQPAQP
jgi:hypothetical protein